MIGGCFASAVVAVSRKHERRAEVLLGRGLGCGHVRVSAFDNVMHFEKLDLRRSDT